MDKFWHRNRQRRGNLQNKAGGKKKEAFFNTVLEVGAIKGKKIVEIAQSYNKKKFLHKNISIISYINIYGMRYLQK